MLDASPLDLDVLRRLPSIFRREGYIDTYTAFGQLHMRHADLESVLGYLPDGLRAMVALWFLCRRLPRDWVLKTLSEDELAACIRLGLLIDEGEKIVNPRYLALVMFGQVLLVPPKLSIKKVYFGPDSGALAVRLQPPVGGRCLDLCSGTGVLALRAATNRGTVVAIDSDPEAGRWASLNVVLNSLEKIIDVRVGDLYGALAPDEKFDYIVSNPPSAVVPGGLAVTHLHDGGADGLELFRRIVNGLPERLNEGGVTQMIAASLGDADSATIAPFLEAFGKKHGMQVLMTVTSRVPLRPGTLYFDGVVAACALEANLEIADVLPRVTKHFADLKATHQYFFFVTITASSPHPGLFVAHHYALGDSPALFFR